MEGRTMSNGDLDSQARLEHAHRVNQVQAARVQAADQRATAVAAAASITASLALAGAAIVVDFQKLASPSWIRQTFGWILVAAVLCFTLAAAVSASAHRQTPPGDMQPTPHIVRWRKRLADFAIKKAARHAGLVASASPAQQKEAEAELGLAAKSTIADKAEAIEKRCKDNWQLASEKHARVSLSLSLLIIGVLIVAPLTALSAQCADAVDPSKIPSEATSTRTGCGIGP
jgi:hypothetical protein